MTAPYTFSQMQQQGYARPPQGAGNPWGINTTTGNTPASSGALYGGAATTMGYGQPAPTKQGTTLTSPTAGAPAPTPQAAPPMPQYQTSTGYAAAPQPFGGPTTPTQGTVIGANPSTSPQPGLAGAVGSLFNQVNGQGVSGMPAAGPAATATAAQSMGYTGAPAATTTAPAGQANTGLDAAVPAALQQQLQTPTGYTLPAFQQMLAAANASINQDQSVQQQLIQENMASRGLGDSTIYTGRLGTLQSAEDLNRQNAAAGLLNQAAQAMGPGQANAIAQAMGYGQTGFQNQLATAQMNNNQQNTQDQYYLQLLQAMGGA